MNAVNWSKVAIGVLTFVLAIICIGLLINGYYASVGALVIAVAIDVMIYRLFLTPKLPVPERPKGSPKRPSPSPCPVPFAEPITEAH